jgi:hypothetical protein
MEQLGNARTRGPDQERPTRTVDFQEKVLAAISTLEHAVGRLETITGIHQPPSEVADKNEPMSLIDMLSNFAEYASRDIGNVSDRINALANLLE